MQKIICVIISLLKKRRNNDKPRISDIMEAVFDAGYLLFDLVTGIVIMGFPF